MTAQRRAETGSLSADRRTLFRPATTRVTPLLMGPLLACLLLAGPPPGAAVEPEERQREVETDISALQEDLVGTSAELQAAYGALAQAQAQLPAAEAALAHAEATLAEALRREAELTSRLAAAEQAQANTEADLLQDADDIARTEESIGRLASQTYRSGGMTVSLSAVLASTDPNEFATTYMLANSLQRRQSSVLYRLEAKRAVQTNAEARLEAVEGAIAQLRQEAADLIVVTAAARATTASRLTRVDQLVRDQRAASEVIAARQAEEQAQLAQLETERQELSAELARLAEETRKAEAARLSAAAKENSKRLPPAPAPSPGTKAPSPAQGRPAPSPPLGTTEDTGGVLLRPSNGRITSGYGYRIHPISGVRRLHAGTDIAAGCGTPLRAAEAGTVVSAGWAGGYGNRVVINHGLVNGAALATTYNHMSAVAVEGGSVSRGQLIGYEGTTGASTGCHVHFEVYVDGATVDPMRWL